MARLVFAVMIGLMASAASADFLWTESNCPASMGNVTDTLCCGKDTFCRKLVTEAACGSDTDDASIYCEWENGQCQPVVDRESNVCCRDQAMNDCAKIFNGECPERFEVEKECCQGDAFTKFAFLETSDPENLVCCSAPCAAREKANCTLPVTCAPAQRSYAVHNPYSLLGFHGYGYGGFGNFDHRFGTIFHGTGFGYDLPYGGYGGGHHGGGYGGHGHHGKRRKGKKGKKHHGKNDYKDDHHDDDYYHDDDHYDDHHDHHYDHKDYDHSKYDHVDEITVDDIFALMIDAMEKESDVKVYDADITSDPYLGKNWSGGLFVDHHLPDPTRIIDELYAHPSPRGPYPHDLYGLYGGFGGGYGLLGGFGGGYGTYGGQLGGQYGGQYGGQQGLQVPYGGQQPLQGQQPQYVQQDQYVVPQGQPQIHPAQPIPGSY